MQGKGLVLVFSIVLGLLSIYYLSFTWYVNNVERKAEKEVAVKMDSLNAASPNLTVSEREAHYNNFLEMELERRAQDTLNLGLVRYDYTSAKDKEMSLGLDLKGGMNVMLQISVRDLLMDLADNSTNSDFIAVLDRTDERQRNSSANYIDDFFTVYRQYKTERGGNLSLASPDWFGTRANADRITINTTDEQAEQIIKEYTEAKMSTAFQVIRARIDQFGVTQPVVQRVGETGGGRILVELPGVKDTDRVKTLLQSTARLEFWEAVRLSDEMHAYMTQLSSSLASAGRSTATPAPAPAVQDTLGLAAHDTVTTESTETPVADAPAGDFINLLNPSPTNSAYLVSLSDTAAVNRALKSQMALTSKPGSMRYMKFLWGNKTFRDQSGRMTDLLPLYAIRGNSTNQPLLDGGVVTSANADRMTQTFSNDVVVSMQMNAQGAQQWFDITKRFVGQPIAIVLDDLVYSAPNINEPIPGGRSQISGDFTMQEAQDLSSVLSAGSLPASARIVQADVVGPSLGKEAIQSGLLSFIIAIAIVFGYMIFFYSGAGWISVLALITNLLFLFGILVSFGAVLTLPGIAGIVLTIGMAVDANVIIYERVKEELLKGKNLKESVNIAYSWKGAISAIFDANVTTMITALVLFFFGEGPVKGFAVTLMIGIFTSVFTSVFISKYLIYSRFEKNRNISFGNKWTIGILKNANYDFLKYKKWSYIFSGALMLISLIAIFTKGLNLGIEFQNGREYKVRFEQPVASNEIASAVGSQLVYADGSEDNPNVVTIGNATQVKITTKYKSDDDRQEVDTEIEEALYTALQPYLPAGMPFDQFVNVSDTQGEVLGLVEYRKVGPSIADDITRNSFYAVGIAMFLVFIYLLIQFRKWEFSSGAVAGVMHDTIIVLGLFSLLNGLVPFSLEINVAFIAAILTVIGYSINDTVIVFDRIREFMYDHPNMPLKKLINGAINTTLTRTMNTSLTTLFVIFIIFLFGGDSIRGFMFALLVGIAIGTYSSVFISSFISHDLIKGNLKNRTAE
ncbi:MAG: protein translocase subunit SecDF [Weeksellaceae bacterium]|nr:protein translocase subunit SecDF [Weeksellaceae bacterium]